MSKSGGGMREPLGELLGTMPALTEVQQFWNQVRWCGPAVMLAALAFARPEIPGLPTDGLVVVVAVILPWGGHARAHLAPAGQTHLVAAGPSVSIGVATSEHISSADELLHRADTAMYRAKAEGKGRVVHFDINHPEDVRELGR